MDILFKNVTVVTMEPDHPFIPNANVGVKDNRIAFIENCEDFKDGDTLTGTKREIPKKTVDGTNKLLIPGLYNCHAHSPTALLRGFANDLALEPWLFDHIFPAEEKIKNIKNAVYNGSMLAIAEMISSGTISFSDMYFGLPDIARAVHDSGVKANLSNAVLSFDPDGYDFKKSSEYSETCQILDYHKEGHGRIKAEASIHCAYTSHPSAWQQVVEFAHEQKLTMHVHLSETIVEHNKSLEMFGYTPTEAFAKHMVFSVPTVAAHSCWVTDEDIDILAQHNVNIAHNPVSNLKLASGVAPIVKMQEKGINVALGTDGMASNNTHDLFEEIKIASILQKYEQKNPTAVPALDSFKMATVNGAKAQNRDGGQIKVGADADLVLLDIDNPRQVPCRDPLISLAYSTTGRDVDMTMCQGQILYEKGEFLTIDIEKIKSEVRRIEI